MIGPEAPLVAGLADQLRDRGSAVFGPGAEGARIGSKSFAKDVMRAAGVPTGHADVFTEYEKATAFLKEHGVPVVVNRRRRARRDRPQHGQASCWRVLRRTALRGCSRGHIEECLEARKYRCCRS